MAYPGIRRSRIELVPDVGEVGLFIVVGLCSGKHVADIDFDRFGGILGLSRHPLYRSTNYSGLRKKTAVSSILGRRIY